MEGMDAHMDHSNCPNPDDCEQYEYWAEKLSDPAEWWDNPLPVRRSAKRQLDRITVLLDSEQLRIIRAAARARGMADGQFLRESALRAAEQPYVKITDASGAFAALNDIRTV